MKYNFIYKTTNLVNGKIYVGHRSSNSLNDKYLGSSVSLIKDINLLGRDNFEREILEICDYEDLSDREKFWILNESAVSGGYNKHLKGTGQQVGFRHSDESKSNMSKNHPDVSREKNPMFGRTGELNPMFGVHRFGEDSPNYNHKRTEESKAKQSETMVGRYDGEKNPFYGKRHAKESIDKIKTTKRKNFEEFGSKLKGVPKSDLAKQHYSESWENRTILECPHCGKKSKNASNMKRYHFDNCKFKIN